MAAGQPGCCWYFLVGKLTFLLLIFTPVSILAVCRFGRIEDGCALPCNCRSGDKCHRDSGCEEGFCQQDIHAGGPFSGEGCQKGNLAFKKSATQTGNFDHMVANRSLDGYVDGGNTYCSHPDTARGTSAWWMVDLGDNYIISSVTIYSGDKADGKYYSG
ncbi:hypothetical protein NP493_37g04013 [Ridgeia piscesae]|uniref:Uncharacterized protein n=1 Tax=Ridgeia piscesae TaxID=27915 RepID=A0AAD9PCC5_RIDPI|nr:hypothetical protein NP493_37g04013 [Ridgeia piscesae]